MFERHKDLHGIHEDKWRVWIERPFLRRVEEYEAPSDVEPSMTRGLNLTSEWSVHALTGRVMVDRRDLSQGIGLLTTDGGRSLYRQALEEADGTHPLFTIDIHPMVAELLSGDLFRTVGRGGLFHEVIHEEFLGRPVARVRMTLHDWGTRGPHWTENLWVADDYEFVIDKATGVILRLACRADGEEFSVREMTEAGFDEAIDPSTWDPPLGLPQKGPPLIARILRAFSRGPRGRFR